jgi:hypothetical protein
MDMDLKIVNPKRRFHPAPLIEPAPNGYIHVAASVRPPRRGPRPARSHARDELLKRLKTRARQLEGMGTVVKATVYEAVVIPPRLTGYARVAAKRPARFDVVVLIETTSPEVIGEVQAAEPYKLLIESVQDTVRDEAKDLHVMTARCGRRLGDVDKTRQGLFVFNYFVADDAEVALKLWEHLAGWFATQTGMDNSTLLEPIGDSDYVFVNHARWEMGAPRFMARMALKPSFRTYVLQNMLVNRTGSMPVLYRLA